jgi:hypothetical protein
MAGEIVSRSYSVQLVAVRAVNNLLGGLNGSTQHLREVIKYDVTGNR